MASFYLMKLTMLFLVIKIRINKLKYEGKMEKQDSQMAPNSYHHGNLRQTLIETGIEYVSKHGDHALSIRKLSSLCGVTHTAIYSYFKNKDALIDAMKDYVCEEFANSMEKEVAAANQQIPQETVYALATGYVRFFLANPRYYYFIFSREDININFDDIDEINSYKPFETFKKYAVPYLHYRQIPIDDQTRVLIDMWATVHGIAGIAILSGTKYSGDWIQTTKDILKKNFSIDSLNSDD